MELNPISGLMLAPVLVLALAGGDGDPPRPSSSPSPSIRAVMHKQYTTSRAPQKMIAKELAAASPDWPKVVASAETFRDLAAILPTRTPPRGTPESWQTLTAKSQSDAKDLEAAARSKDVQALRAVHRRIADACNACHNAHRVRP